MKFERKQLQIPTSQQGEWKYIWVEARIYGPLALNRPPRWDRSWDGNVVNITHIETGLMMATAPLPVAETLIEKLLELDWNFDHPENVPTETREKAKEILGEHLATGSPAETREWEAARDRRSKLPTRERDRDRL